MATSCGWCGLQCETAEQLAAHRKVHSFGPGKKATYKPNKLMQPKAEVSRAPVSLAFHASASPAPASSPSGAPASSSASPAPASSSYGALPPLSGSPTSRAPAFSASGSPASSTSACST